MLARTPAADLHAARQRRYRARVKRRECIARGVIAGEAVVEMLVRERWLDPRDEHRNDRIGDAISRFMLDAASGAHR